MVLHLNSMGKLFLATVAAKVAVDALAPSELLLPNGWRPDDAAFSMVQAAKAGDRTTAGNMLRSIVASLPSQTYKKLWLGMPELDLSSPDRLWALLIQGLEAAVQGDPEGGRLVLETMRELARINS